MAVKIERVRIRRYRCLKDLTLDVADYTALVGPNGSGKSSVLYALDWFFDGGSLSPEDVHSPVAGQAADAGDGTEIDVEVTFGNLTTADRDVLGQYSRGDRATFRRIWSPLDGKEKMIGNARQGPGFAAIRAEPLIANMRAQYKQARDLYPTLEDVMKKEDILDQLNSWEADPANVSLLEDVSGAEASHMFGLFARPTRQHESRVMRLRPALVLAVSMLLLAVACDGAATPEADDSFLSEGDRAPGFTLPSASGEQASLADFTGNKPVLLYFSMGPG